LFPPEKEKRNNIAAHCIHHHNNYMLTTNAFFGSGYETFLFEKNPKVFEETKELDMKITRHFHQKDVNPSTIDSWEPHMVFIPEELSATILIWTPDIKRKTDNLRRNPILKYFKKPIRWTIYKMGLINKFGIAEKGPEVDNYSAQMIFAFIQRAGLFDESFFNENRDNIPTYYHQFIDMIAAGEQIPDVYHRTEINIPQKTYYKEDVLRASGEV
jgi:hypothetical protein